ncbi:hypothetical protein BC936DRAFT_148368 [Jimgerdemannia flammicorona]|uniref:Protein kinase domain-containing protein n=1 Tax=Jimgerdemannia flammicorona TaxID=994334 RepID=A0A433D371_9FUNG|nr:hypothetical protein BC936DRAFT_148368 [Jimgerdemannia flammicorona]
MPFECSTQKALTDAITQGDLDLTPFTAEGGYNLTTDCSQMPMIKKIGVNLHDPSVASHHSPPAKDFVTRLLEVDPKQRMTADEALKHPWLMDVTTTTVNANLCNCKIRLIYIMNHISNGHTIAAQVDFKIETVQEVSSELPIPLKRELSSGMYRRDGFWPSLSTGLTHIFESNEFLSAPELTTEAGPSNIDRPQAQPKTRVQKHSSSGSPGSPRRVTRAQSKLQVAESAHITTVTNKKRPAPSTDPESPVHDIDQTPTFPMEIVTSAGVGAVDPLPSQSSTTRIGRTNTLPLDDNMGNDKCNESTMPYYRCTEPVDGITDMDFDYASNSTRVNQSILTENGQSINTEDDDNIKEEDVPWAVLRLVDRSREGTDAGCWADRLYIIIIAPITIENSLH